MSLKASLAFWEVAFSKDGDELEGFAKVSRRYPSPRSMVNAFRSF